MLHAYCIQLQFDLDLSTYGENKVGKSAVLISCDLWLNPKWIVLTYTEIPYLVGFVVNFITECQTVWLYT